MMYIYLKRSATYAYKFTKPNLISGYNVDSWTQF